MKLTDIGWARKIVLPSIRDHEYYLPSCHRFGAFSLEILHRRTRLCEGNDALSFAEAGTEVIRLS